MLIALSVSFTGVGIAGVGIAACCCLAFIALLLLAAYVVKRHGAEGLREVAPMLTAAKDLFSFRIRRPPK